MSNAQRSAMTSSEVEMVSCRPVTSDGIHPPVIRNVAISNGPWTDYYEEMTPNNVGSHHSWKTFAHYKIVRSKSATGSVFGKKIYFRDWGYSPYYQGNVSSSHWPYRLEAFGDAGKPTKGLTEMHVAGAYGEEIVPPPTGLDSLNQRALSHMLPIIKSELSLINSVIELKDFKSLPRTLSDISKPLSRTFRWAGTKVNSVLLNKESTLRTISRTGSDGYLQMKFNILPLLSDISGIHAALTRTEKRLNDLITRSGRVQMKHFSFKWSELDSSTELSEAYLPRYQDIPDTDHVCNYRFERVVQAEPTSFHAQIQYNYNYTGYQLAHAQVLAYLDAFGVNLNPSIIWNAIPWSFVVDWVFGVNRFLNQFSFENMKPVINIRRYLWSVRRERRIYVHSILSNAGSYSPPLPIGCRYPLPVVRETSYRRQSVLPSISSILSSGLSLTEFSLGAALVLSRKRRRPPRLPGSESYRFPSFKRRQRGLSKDFSRYLG